MASMLCEEAVVVHSIPTCLTVSVVTVLCCSMQLVLRKHPAMRGVMVREVQQYLHRPGLAPKALYAGVIFLTQV